MKNARRAREHLPAFSSKPHEISYVSQWSEQIANADYVSYLLLFISDYIINIFLFHSAKLHFSHDMAKCFFSIQRKDSANT